MTTEQVSLAEQPTPEQDEARLSSIWQFVWTHGPENNSAAGHIRFLLRLLDTARAERDAARESVMVMAERSAKRRAEHKATLQQYERGMAEMEAAYQNCAELAMTYHGRLERAMAVVEAARRARKSMRLLIQELSEPGTEALAAEWELGHVLAALDDAASAAGDAG